IKKQTIRLAYQPKIRECLSCPERYKESVFDAIVSDREVKYGSASGYYTSKPIDKIPNNNYVQIGKEIWKELKNTVFGKRTDQSLYMDVYQPAGDSQRQRPLFLFIHGGAFFFGDKVTQTQTFLTDDLVKKGFVVISVNYRLGTTLKGAAAVENAIYRGVQDVRAALRYVINHSDGLGIDPRQIYIGGNSAGGIIALTTAFMDDHEVYKSVNIKELGGLDGSGNRLSADIHLAGVVSLWGGLSDLNFINNTVPVLLFHGTNDDIVQSESGLPFKDVIGDFLHNMLASSWRLHGSASIYKYMNQNDLPVRYVPFNGYGHEPQTGGDGSFNQNMYKIRDEISRFLYRQWEKQFPGYTLEGDADVHPSDATSVYRVAHAASSGSVQWRVQGGIILEQTTDAVKVVWYDKGGFGQVTACITDATGVLHKKELRVRIHRY
ncbi:MAG: alpha/beta hydrolase, partial [Tannerella sp.]|nr:alpha/beta hydrolase [Tannerella sp.]